MCICIHAHVRYPSEDARVRCGKMHHCGKPIACVEASTMSLGENGRQDCLDIS